ncbi:MAG: hypothetical protein ABH956_02175 [Candidatus Nealsonbacteria bacterium]
MKKRKGSMVGKMDAETLTNFLTNTRERSRLTVLSGDNGALRIHNVGVLKKESGVVILDGNNVLYQDQDSGEWMCKEGSKGRRTPLFAVKSA